MIRRSTASFRFVATRAAEEAFGADLGSVASHALHAVIAARRGLEIAHLQFRFRKRCVALCSRITRAGEIEIELDLGDARLPAVVFTEGELRAADRHCARPDTRRRNAMVGSFHLGR